MKKRWLALLLAGVMTVGSLVGCGQNAEETTGEKESISNESVSKESTDSDSEVVEYEPVTLKIMVPCDSETGEAALAKPAGQKYLKDLEEIGITIEYEYVASSLSDVLNTRIAAGVDLPDLVSCGWYDASQLYEWGDNGLICDIGELLDQYDTDDSIRTFYQEYAPGAWEMTQSPTGNNYWFSYLMNIYDNTDITTGEKVTNSSVFSFYIRADWVEAVGEEVKSIYSLDEFVELLKKIHDEDANGNGSNDEIIHFYRTQRFDVNLAPLFGLNADTICGYRAGDTEVTANVFNENYPEYIKLMQSLYEYGLIDSSSLSTSEDEMIATNRVAVYGGYMTDPDGKSDLLPGYDENDLETCLYVPIIIDNDDDLSNGVPMYTDNPWAQAHSKYIVPSASENAEAVVRYMDYICTVEYAELDQYGLEGENAGFTRDENGNIVTTGLDTEEAERFTGGWTLAPSMVVLPSVVDIKEADTAAVPKNKQFNELNYLIRSDLQYKAKEEGILAYRTMGWGVVSDEEEAFIAEKKEVFKTYIEELNTGLILGEKSLDDLPTYLQELEDLGLNEYVEIYQKKFDAVRPDEW